MSSTSQQQQVFLDEVEHTFLVKQTQLNAMLQGFIQDMKSSLKTPGSTGLKMIPSFVTGYPTGDEKGTYLAVEISGIDIYVCQCILKGDHGKLAINQYQYKIPDDYTTGEDVHVLIEYVTDCVVDFLQRVGACLEDPVTMCISLGFAIQQTSLDHGIIVGLEHGFGYTNAIGCDIVDLFRFEERGLAVKIVAVANDTVCTLLAHAYQHPMTRIGIVHGAGTNCSYYDHIDNINMGDTTVSPSSSFYSSMTDDDDDDNRDMIINTEWCSFGGHHLPRNEFDIRVDEESNNQGIHLFEKMTTGMYLGELVRHVLVYLNQLGVISFFNNDDEDCLLDTPYHFDTSYMYVCEADQDNELNDTRVILEEMCQTGATSLNDRLIVKKVCSWVGQRAARLLGTNVASVVTYMVEQGIVDPNEEFAIAISGDIYEDYPNFHPRVCSTVRSMIDPHVASRLSVGIVKHSRIVGAAIVAMMAGKTNYHHRDYYCLLQS
ncbi:hypothetical protein BCR42DRAFT_421201 [Absidia repens]|uniref:Phosphotransferase n=1 Tax=Absidia repens TaxID=90262 RepID=A0A1X2I869_9FUNG|nr:hypothetical protein BCR42DRAFT_421201 [Absidia repens]